MYKYSNSLLTKFTFSIKISKNINFLISVVYYRQLFYKIKSFCFISNILKLQQLHYNNFCQNFNWFFEKIKKSFYLDKSRKRKTDRKSRKIFHLSGCCEQPHPPTPSPNREGENIPLCQERVPEACSAMLRAGEVVKGI